MTSRQTGFALLQLGEALLVIGLLFFQAVTTAWAADLTWMAEEQNCKQFIRKFQAELRGESGIRSMPEGEQREARDALRKACAGPIGRCEFSFCSVEGDEPVVINRPIAKVDIGALIGTGEGEAPEANARPAPTLPAERRAPVGDAKNANAKKASAPRERHPLYDPRQRRLLDELDAEDEAEKQRSAAARAAEDQLKEQLLRELGTQDPSPGLNLSVDQVVLERAPKPEPQPTPTAAVEDVVEVTPSPREQPEALATLTQPEVEAAPTATPDSREEMEAVATPSIALANVTPTPSELTSLPPIDEVRKPTSPWSRAGTFPRTPISTSTTVAPALQESPEALARAADLARQQRLQWLKNEMGCKELLSEIKTRYSDVRPPSGFPREVKLDLWEVLNTACSPRFAKCKFPQCVKLNRLNENSEARRAAEDEAKASAHEELTEAARNDLNAEIIAVTTASRALIRETEERERREKRSWQKFQMQSEILDRQKPPQEKTETNTPEERAVPSAEGKGRYDPTVYAKPKDLDRAPNRPQAGQGGMPNGGVPNTKKPIKATGTPPPGRIF